MEAVAGRRPDHVMTGALDAVVPSWSRDGRFLYFASHPAGVWDIFRTPVSGGEPERITRHGGFRALEAWDGESICYTKPATKGIWRLRLASKSEQALIPDFPASAWGDWALGQAGIYFLRPDVLSHPRAAASLELLSWNGQEPPQLGHTEKGPTNGGFSVSPDGSAFLYTQLDRTGSDILLLERY